MFSLSIPERRAAFLFFPSHLGRTLKITRGAAGEFLEARIEVLICDDSPCRLYSLKITGEAGEEISGATKEVFSVTILSACRWNSL